MNRIWQWAWDRYGSTYSWAIYAVTFPLALPLDLAFSLIIVGFEGSANYVGAPRGQIIAAAWQFGHYQSGSSSLPCVPGTGSAVQRQRAVRDRSVRPRPTVVSAEWIRGGTLPAGHRQA